MNGWKLTRRIGRLAILAAAGATVACADAPKAQDLSIVEVIEHPRVATGAASCAALNAALVCEKSTRLDGDRKCQCVDPRALTGTARF